MHQRMRINSSYLLHGDTASDLGSHIQLCSVVRIMHSSDGNSGTYLTIAVGAANGTVDLEADARSGDSDEDSSQLIVKELELERMVT